MENDNITNVTPVEPEVLPESDVTVLEPTSSAEIIEEVSTQPVATEETPVAPAPEVPTEQLATPVVETPPVQEPALNAPNTVAQPAQSTVEPVPAPTQETTATTTTPVATSKNSKKKVNNKVVLLALLVLIIFGIGYYYMGSKKNPLPKKANPTTNTSTEKTYNKLDTGTTWGDEYSVEAQRFLDTFDAIDVSFIDLDFNGVPEMIVKYTEDKKTSLQIFSLSEANAVKSSKAFVNSSLELIYSLIDGQSRFYVHIKNNDKYGTYTEAKKIIETTVKKVDIEATNDNQVSDFKEHYVVSDYNITYYEVKKSAFEENFKTMLGRTDRYAKEISDERDNLDENNKANVVKREDSNDSLATADYKLAYGKYTPDELYITDGSINPNIYLNNDSTITIGEETFRFEVNTNYLVLENGKNIKVIGNDSIMTEGDGEIIYRAENPINMTDKEKRDIENDIKAKQRDERQKEKEQKEIEKNGEQKRDTEVIS